MKDNSVLFVDDEFNILSALKRALFDVKYTCFFASSGKEALDIMKKNDISVLVTDMRMPEMDGLTLIKAVKKTYPDVVRIVLSGYTQLPQILATINQGDIFRFITKPWEVEDDLKDTLIEAIEYYNFKKEINLRKEVQEKRNTTYVKIMKSTDQKLSDITKDTRNIRVISTCTFNILKSKYSAYSRNNGVFENLLVLEELYSGYLDTLPSSKDEFTCNQISNELKEYILENKSNVITIDNSSTSKFYGNKKLLLIIIVWLLKHMIDKISNREIVLKIREEQDLLMFYFIDNKRNSFSELNNIIVDASGLLKKLLNLINGNIEFKEVKDYKILAISTQFKTI
jgi:YesN/AraC family two-component response regulator